MNKNYTVEEVMELVTVTLNNNFASTDEGQAHLNRIAKAITNESLEKRTTTMRKTNAKKAFDKKVAEVAAKSPEKLQALLDRKSEWVSDYIERKYGKDED